MNFRDRARTSVSIGSNQLSKRSTASSVAGPERGSGRLTRRSYFARQQSEQEEAQHIAGPVSQRDACRERLGGLLRYYHQEAARDGRQVLDEPCQASGRVVPAQ